MHSPVSPTIRVWLRIGPRQLDLVITDAERASHKSGYTREVRPAGGKFERVFSASEQLIVAERVETVDLKPILSAKL